MLSILEPHYDLITFLHFFTLYAFWICLLVRNEILHLDGCPSFKPGGRGRNLVLLLLLLLLQVQRPALLHVDEREKVRLLALGDDTPRGRLALLPLLFLLFLGR